MWNREGASCVSRAGVRGGFVCRVRAGRLSLSSVRAGSVMIVGRSFRVWFRGCIVTVGLRRLCFAVWTV